MAALVRGFWPKEQFHFVRDSATAPSATLGRVTDVSTIQGRRIGPPELAQVRALLAEHPEQRRYRLSRQLATLGERLAYHKNHGLLIDVHQGGTSVPPPPARQFAEWTKRLFADICRHKTWRNAVGKGQCASSADTHQTADNIGHPRILPGFPSCCEVVIGSRPLIATDRCAQQKAPVMNAQFSLTANGAQPLRILRHLPSPDARKTRVAVFGSFMGGYHGLRELLLGPLSRRVVVVGLATDDPTREFTHAKVRLWKHPHNRDDELIAPRLTGEHGLPVFTGRVKTPEFFAILMDDWQPQLCLMATFGQKIPNALINYPSLGFYNFHHSGDTWPSYAGPDPIAAMVRDGRKHLVLTIHKVTDVIDGGEFVARSHLVAIPEGIDAVGMHRITWPQMGPFIRREVGAMLDAATTMPATAPLVLQEVAPPYGSGSQREWAERLAA